MSRPFRHKITWHKDGTGECLYTDEIDLRQLGQLSVERASSVEFDDASQEWHVRLPGGQCIASHANRSVALELEAEYFQTHGFSPPAPEDPPL